MSCWDELPEIAIAPDAGKRPRKRSISRSWAIGQKRRATRATLSGDNLADPKRADKLLRKFGDDA